MACVAVTAKAEIPCLRALAGPAAAGLAPFTDGAPVPSHSPAATNSTPAVRAIVTNLGGPSSVPAATNAPAVQSSPGLLSSPAAPGITAPAPRSTRPVYPPADDMQNGGGLLGTTSDSSTADAGAGPDGHHTGKGSSIRLLDSSPLSSKDAAPGIADASDHETGHEKPVVVSISLRVLNFERVDTKNGTFRFAGQLIAEWDPSSVPPKLRGISPSVQPPSRGARLIPGPWKGWEPSLIMMNILADVNMGHPVYFLLSNGRVRAEVRFSAPSVASRMDFCHFPFDTQFLVLEMAPGGDNLLPVRLEPLEKEFRVDKDVRLSEWRIQGASAYSTMSNRVHFCVEVRRYWGHYVGNIFLPMFIIVAVSYATMWVPRNNLPGACSLVGITIASLFLLKLTVSQELARTDGLTFLDAIAIFHVAAAATAATLNVVIARLWRELPDPLDEGPARMPRIAFPIAYFAGWVLIAIYYFMWLDHVHG
ncbi:hypothetical protein DB346_17390 [Verrucomicrobia bacterium LW23]|nr:hypothetical protein DB346_17390 [Verrucomicrobia bacterium LW23]